MAKLFNSTEKNTGNKLLQTTADFAMQISTISHVTVFSFSLLYVSRGTLVQRREMAASVANNLFLSRFY